MGDDNTLSKGMGELQQELAAANEQIQDLRNQLDILTLLIDESPALVTVLDRDLCFLTSSKRYIEAFHLDMESLAGKHVTEVFPRLQEDWLLDLQECLKGKSIGPLQRTIQLRDGRVETISRMLTPLKNEEGDTAGVIILNEIITRQVEAEMALKESEQKYREMVENINDVIYLISPDGVVTYVSPVIHSLIGYSPDDIVGKPFMRFVHPDDYGLMSRKFAMKKQIEGSPTECRLTCRDGSYRLVRVSSKPLYRNGEIVELGGVLTDISKERKNELEKRRLEKQLQQARKMEAIGTLAGSVAHDLNNILSGLVSYPDILLLEIPEGSPQRRVAETIKRAGERAAVIVQDLLTLARRGLTEMVVVDVNRIIQDYLQSPEAKMLKKERPEVVLEYDQQIDLPKISGSPVHLSKVIMNLLNNGVEAISGKGTVTISTREVTLKDEAVLYDETIPGDYVEITVRDSGVGIKEEELEKIFEPFFSTKQLGRSGTGLGMAIVWNTVQDHDGYIAVQSEPGKGTTMRLLFPVCDTDGAQQVVNRDLKIEDLQGQGEKILLVDDLQEQLEIGSTMLQKLGYKVITASSGEKAVELLRTSAVDLVILDMIMDPGQDGFESYKQILEIHPAQKAVIASGYAEEERMMEAMQLGINVFVRKPYTLKIFGQAVLNGLCPENS